MWLFSVFMFLIFIVLGVVSGLTPLFSRQSTPFGVSVRGRHDRIEEKKKSFALWNIIAAFLLGLPMFVFPLMEDSQQAEMISSIYMVAAILIFMLISFGLYLKYRKEIMAWKSREGEQTDPGEKKVVVDTSYHQKLEARSHWTFLIWQLVIIIIPVIIAMIFYDAIPDQIPINWDSQFQVNNWVDKSVWTVLALPGIQVLMIPVFNFSHHAIIKSKQRLSPLDPQKASEKSRRFREAWSGVLFIMTIATQILISFLFLYSLFGKDQSTWLLFTSILLYLLVVIAGPLYLTLKYGQAGEKLLDEEDQYYQDPDEEDAWKWGLFYVNKQDPSVFVEKRFGIGSTLNLARWQAWAFIGGLILFILLTLAWTFLLT